jgi:hypothetical protein
MRLYAIFLLLLGSFSGVAQKVTLSGKVVDKDSGEPLSYASIVLKGKALGTVANDEGSFDFHFPAENRMDIIVVSMLGYENYEAPAWSLLDSEDKTIRLTKVATMLSEIVVTDTLSGGEIFRVALAKIDQNYPAEPFLMDGFYRDVKKVDDSYVALLEAAVKIYDDNYAAPRNKLRLRERVKLIEVRKSLGYENRFAMYFSQQNMLEDLLLHNNIRYRQIGDDDAFFDKINREDDSKYNNNEIYVLSYDEDFHLKVYIDKTDHAIVHLEVSKKDTGDNLARKKNFVSRSIAYRKTIDFRRYNSKMYLNYISVTTEESWYDQASNKFKFNTELIQDLMINSIDAHPAEKISATEKMKAYGLEYQDYPYNKKFWEDYNVLKETPVDIKIREDLEREVPLEKQFEDY